MSESFLEEQIKRIRELSARISESERRQHRADLTRLLERTRREYGPLEAVRDFAPHENDHDADAAPHRAGSPRRRTSARTAKRRRQAFSPQIRRR